MTGDPVTTAGNHPVHASCREACPAAMATSPSTAVPARDASNRREGSSTVRCATEPEIGDAPGKPVTTSNLRLWAPARTAADLAGSSSQPAYRPSRSRTAVLLSACANTYRRIARAAEFAPWRQTSATKGDGQSK
jgi:hypothetical protein